MCAARKIKLPGRWQEWGNDLFPLDHDRGTGHPLVWYQNQTWAISELAVATYTYTPVHAREKSLNFLVLRQQQMGDWPICDTLGLPISVRSF